MVFSSVFNFNYEILTRFYCYIVFLCIFSSSNAFTNQSTVCIRHSFCLIPICRYSLTSLISLADKVSPFTSSFFHTTDNSVLRLKTQPWSGYAGGMASGFHISNECTVKGLGKKFFSLIKDFLTTRKSIKQPITNYLKESYKMNLNTNASQISGPCVGGDVIDHIRRYVPKDNPATEIVTYTIQDNNDRKFYVDDYAPDNYYDIGEQVCLPVYVKPYQKHNKELAHILCIQKTSSRGEHF